METKVKIGGKEYPKNGWAVIFAGGSASGKSTLIKNGQMLFEGETLSTDTAGEDIIEVHNNAARYAKEDPERLREAERLVELGCANRYGTVCLQNIHLDLACKTWGLGKMSTVLSNGAHSRKEQIFRQHITAAASRNHANLLLDMTGKEKEVEMYKELLIKNGYKVAIVWVIANRTQAILWNLLRPRRMNIDAVHSGHDGPNKYMLDYLQDSRSRDIEDAWLVFNTTETPARPMTEEEKQTAIVRLTKQGDRFVVDETVAERVRKVIGPLSPKAAEDSEEPQWQMDETGKAPLVVDDAFFGKYTREVTLADGTKAHALLQLRSSSDKKKGGLVVCDDKEGGTGEPKLQKCSQKDTPTYPYVIITEADKGKKIQRRHGMMHGYTLKTEKVKGGATAKMISDTQTLKFFERIRLMRKVARDHGVAEPLYSDILFSVLDDDKKAVEAKIKEFYKTLGIKEPALPEKPEVAYPVNEPIREQFRKEADYLEAVKQYPVLLAAYEKAVKEWAEYENNFV